MANTHLKAFNEWGHTDTPLSPVAPFSPSPPLPPLYTSCATRPSSVGWCQTPQYPPQLECQLSAVVVSAVVQQFYQSEVNNEYVIRGNAAVLKCSIPSFVADFVSVVSWHDEAGESFTPNSLHGKLCGVTISRMMVLLCLTSLLSFLTCPLSMLG